MKALFTGFLTVSLSGSLIIVLVLLLRLMLKKAPKRVLCALWLLVIIRLLLPVQLESPFCIRPETPKFVGTDTRFFGEEEFIFADEVPQYMPVQIEYRYGNAMATVDYIWILSLVWTIGVSVLLAYTLITYIRLKFLVRESVRIEKNIFECTRLDSAFLLGYITPRIYMPHSMTEENAKIVIAHEQAHIRRGDNWLKLLAFVALALHWYNPLVWVVYLLICRDIEAACDERVIRELDEQGRVAYSSALLACGKNSKTIAGCPVAFGEVSIHDRIVNVLKYRKPALWLSIISMLLVVAVAIFFIADPASSISVEKLLPYYEELSSSIGMPLSTICDKLNISEKDTIDLMVGRGMEYQLPVSCQYEGAEFEITVFLDTEYNLTRFIYGAYIQGDQRKAAASAERIGKIFLAAYGEPTDDSTRKGDLSVKKLSQENLLKVYKNEREVTRGVDSVYAAWDISDGQPDHIINYLYRYREMPLWKERYTRYADVAGFMPYPRYGVSFNTWRNTESDTVVIGISYGRMDMNSEDGGVRYREYERQNWLEKAVSWLR